MHSCLFFTFEGNAGARCFCKAVDVVCLDTESLLDIFSHFFGPGLGAENSCFEGNSIGCVALLFKRFAYIGSVGRGATKNGCVKVGHKLNLTVGIARRHRQCEASDLVASAVKTCAACEKSVAVCNLADVLFCSACGNDGTGAAIFPQIYIVLGIEGDNTAACCTRSGLNSHTVFKGFCKKAVGVGISKVCLG